MDGFIIAAPLRAGHLVKATDMLFKLDDADLQLEQAKWHNQREQYQTQYRHALAQGSRAEARALKAQLAQAEDQLALVHKQLDRATGYAPFEGIIVSGDLSQSLGAPIERGDVLFEVAPLENYRVVLQVDEMDIAAIQEQQPGNLVLTSFTTQSFPFVITKITPISETKEAHNYFRVEAHLVQTTTLLRPGMKGLGKIEVGERYLFWIWTRHLMNWLRLWLWSWWP
ncbi:MAG: HlyD family efflux transporter periplasmic adaptor subunit [Thioploca sp.]|nr:HlyD family efflux transporter periplasmic adaptor subunit [Thioploca sp.]